MTKRLLELFSGTHSIGRVAEKMGYEVTSLDRDLPAKSKLYDYTSKNHIQHDIMTWDYKIYPEGHFDVITASPVCLFWSCLLPSNFGREISRHPGVKFNRELLEKDIEDHGKPMVNKVREIIDYFKPKYYWIENPKTGRMKDYITDLPYYDVDYCKYSDWGYKKSTRFWTNIQGFDAKTCKKDCDNIITIKTDKKDSTLHKKNAWNNKRPTERKLHIKNCGNGEQAKLTTKHAKEISKVGGGSNRLERYRIPEQLIKELLELCEE
jgi:hypothetical protein